jgi:hypothetical protein
MRIGETLKLARIELSPRYRNLTLFAAERGIDYRVCWDIEHGARENYRITTRRAVEVAYGQPLGWIDEALAAGSAEAIDRPRFPADPDMDKKAARIWALRFDDQGRIMTDDAARTIIHQLAALEAAKGNSERQAG